MRHRTPDHAGRWQAIAYAAISAAVLTNAAWFYGWRARAVEHHNELILARASEPEPVIVYRYRDRPERVPPRQAAPAAEERCIYGQILRKIPDGWAGTGRTC